MLPNLMGKNGLRGTTKSSSVPKVILPGHRLSMRSCQLCHRRKIRCDKRKGSCSSCLRANTPCLYPGTERAPRRPHKTTITDVASRVTELERAVATMSSGHGNALTIPTSEDHLSHSHDSNEAYWPGAASVEVIDGAPETRMHRASSSEGLLVTDGGSSRFVNEVMLSRVLDEERELQSAIQIPQGCVTQDPNSIESIDIGMPFSHFRKPSPDDQSRLPSYRHAIQLWRTYVDNFDPVGKVLHVPTMEVALFRALKDPTNIDSDLGSLLFGIYFAAITTLDSSNIESFYGEQKATLLVRFKEGLEQSLAACDFLAHPTMRAVQAMAIYLRCLRAYNLGRSSWTLFGLMMRAAQSIGLHRDGLDLRLSAFESEMRRRLWWFICSIETRAAEDHGISVSNYAVKPARPRFPSNLHDSDLYPGMTELPPSRPMWTAMSFLLVILEISFVMRRDTSSSSSGNSSEASPEQILEANSMQLEDNYLKHCIPDIPVQRATILMGALLSAKANFIRQQQELRTSDLAPLASTATEESLIAATQILEISVQLHTEDTLMDFHWLFRTYIQYHPLLYVFWHLCIKPTGPNVDQAWATGLQAFEIASRRESSAERELKWPMVQTLKRKAFERRQNPADQQFVSYGSDHGFPALTAPVGIDDTWDPKIWDIDSLGLADWSNLVDEVSNV